MHHNGPTEKSQISNKSKGTQRLHKEYEKLEKAGHSTAENFQEQFHDMKDKAAEYYEESREKVVNFIQQKPLTSVLIAAGTGFLLSFIRSVLNDKYADD